jgi:uncharacterized iron-regulated membrane protein
VKRRGAALVALLLAASPAWGQAPAPQPASKAQLGRLFHTPQQRQELERRRELNIQEVVVAVSEGTLTLNGQVTRSSGKTTTWVNGAPQHDAHRPRDPATVPLSPSQGEARVPVKVGQTLDRSRGTVTDNLQGGSATVERPERGAR